MKMKTNPYGIKTGEIITFGRYPQGSNSEIQPIRWKVLDLNEKTALLITEDCLIMSGYCDGKKGYGNPWYLMWGNCLAREVCNGIFFHQAFDWYEKKVIEPKMINDTVNGPVCTDEVFLLSEREVVLYMDGPEKRKAGLSPKLYSAEKSGVPLNSEGYAFWWVLPEEPGRIQGGVIYPKAVDPDGEIHFHGRNIYHGDYTIRPCILINLDRYREYVEKIKDSLVTKLPGDPQTSNNSDQGKKINTHPKVSGGQAYSLAYIQGYEGAARENRVGARISRHDRVDGKWVLTIQLDKQSIWFLSVYVNDDGTFDKFSLDYEMASDSHYEFRDERELRKKIYRPGDEKKYLAEVLIEYVRLNGGNALLSQVYPFITAQYHYD